MPRRFDRIQTERLILRRWLLRDRAPFAVMNADPEVMRYFPARLDRETSDAFADRIDARLERQGFGLWALERRDTAEFIGFTGLNPMPAGTPGAGGQEIGWRLAANSWHQGYATEAAKAVVGVAFNGLNLPEIWSITSVLNEPSRAVMRRLGMTEHSFFDHPTVPLTSPLLAHVACWLPNPSGGGNIPLIGRAPRRWASPGPPSPPRLCSPWPGARAGPAGPWATRSCRQKAGSR